MDGSYTHHLPIWDDWAPPEAVLSAPDAPAVADRLDPEPRPLTGLPPVQVADALFLRESMRRILGRRFRPPDAYSPAWFEAIEQLRYQRQGPWLPGLLEFAKHPGDTLLGLGEGLGTDWAQYARHGANVLACCRSGEQLAVVRRNFESRGLSAQYLLALPGRVPVPSDSVDVACLHGLPSDGGREIVAEVFRVLRPGGKVLALLPARYDVTYWMDVFCPWQRWLWGKRLSPIDGRRFTAKRLRRTFAAFADHRIRKRQLRRSDLPHLLRFLPLLPMERLMGKILVLKAFKPVTAALPGRSVA